MKVLSHLAFCVLLLAGFGCAITDYGTITDNNQVTAKASGKFSGVQPVIDTGGKAHIKECSQIATIWPDGTDELFSFVDQKADGTSSLTTYNNHSTGAEPTFHEDLYCDLSREGCAIVTAPDDNDGNLFDAEIDTSCFGARSLSILLATGRYYGECGRLKDGRGDKLDLISKSRLFNSAVFANRVGREGLLYRLNPGTLGVELTTETGQRFAVPLYGAVDLWTSSQDNISLLDLRNPLISTTMMWYAEFLGRDATETTAATVSYNGISATFTIAGAHPDITPERVLEIRSRAY